MVNKKMLQFEDQNEDNHVELKINQEYAKRFEHNKRREEIEKLEQKYGEKIKRAAYNSSEEEGSDQISDSSTDNESEMEEDEQGVLITPEIDVQILKTISDLRAKNKEIYNPDVNYFSGQQMEQIKAKWKILSDEQRKKGEKQMSLKEYHNKILLEGFTGEEDETKTATFNEEQEALKRELKFAIDKEISEDEEILLKKSKPQKTLEEEEEEYKKFILESLHNNKAADKTMKTWLELDKAKDKQDSLNEEETFLAKFMLNRSWIDKSKTKKPIHFDISDSEDEELIEETEEFETIYNFRYEQEGGTQLVSHARSLEGLVRRDDDSRRKKRKKKLTRKQEEKLREVEEIKRLKNLKKIEMLEKVNKIMNVAGKEINELDAHDLEDDFDPEKFDKKMAEIFNDEYYNQKELDKSFKDDKETLKDLIGDDYENDELLEIRQKIDNKNAKLSQKDEKLEDEYFKLHYEDKIDGLKTRFHYSSVLSSSFGLTLEEILLAEDKLLNSHVSIKKLAPYKPKEEQEKELLRLCKKKRLKKFQHEFKKSFHNKGSPKKGLIVQSE